MIIYLFFILASSKQLVTLTKSKDTYVLATFEPNTCCEIDLHIYTYCNFVNAMRPVSRLLLLSKNAETGTNVEHYYDDSQHFDSRTKGRHGLHKGTISTFNSSDPSQLILKRGTGCFGVDLDLIVYQLKIYKYECPSNKVTGLGIIIIMSIFLMMLTVMVTALCECCNCISKKVSHMR
jgi:hypothetical protein